jgi:hypothetical protein
MLNMTPLKKIFPILLFSLTAVCFNSCEKAEEFIEVVSETEAVEIIETTLQTDVGGLTTNLEGMAEQLIDATTSGELCDTPYDNTVGETIDRPQIQASYSIDYAYQLTCNALSIPQSATWDILTSSSYSTQRIGSTDEGVFTGSATGLQPSSSSLILAGNYVREGTQDLSFRTPQNVSSTLSVVIADIEINKQSLDIVSGEGTLSFTDNSPENAFNFEGRIVFTGNNTATLTLNGNTYQLDWN